MQSDVERLRELVRKRRAAATAKIGRLRRNTGVEIAGTKEDPRRPPSVIKRYSKPQLNKYLAELNAFTSRDNQFVAGAGGTPLSRNDWNAYKIIEKRYNEIGTRHDNKIADIFIPTAGMTIKERMATIHPTAVGEFSNRPYSTVDRKPYQIASSDALSQLTRDMRRKISRKFLPGEISKGREQMREMLSSIGHTEFIKRADKLTDSQFDIVWNYTSMARLISLVYELMKLRSADESKKERWHDKVVEDSEDELGELFDFAEVQPKNFGGNSA